MKAAIYARYSSHEQDGSSTIESQVRECEDYIRKQKWEIDHCIDSYFGSAIERCISDD